MHPINGQETNGLFEKVAHGAITTEGQGITSIVVLGFFQTHAAYIVLLRLLGSFLLGPEVDLAEALKGDEDEAVERQVQESALNGTL